MQTIKSDSLIVQIDELGAELQSIRDLVGNEYLWQGDPQYWTGRAPNLFPYIARLTDKKYTYNGQMYEMDIHGFAKKMVFDVERISDNKVAFSITENEETLAVYPFSFCFQVIYSLEDNKLSVLYSVENKNESSMYFGIGGHPGFCVPMENGLSFEDYYLEFAEPTHVKRVMFSEDCFVLDEEQAFKMEDGVKLSLQHSLFDQDAIILKDMSKAVTLKSDKGCREIRVEYPDMSYLGFWHRPKSDAPYVCIEPWSSLPSRKDVIEDFATQPSLIALEAGQTYQSKIDIYIK